MQRDRIDFGSMNIPVLFRKIFFPTLLGMVCMACITIADGIFVGRGVGSDALAAVNIVAPIFMVTTGIGLLFGVGSSVVASVHLSQRKVKAANINITQALLVSLLLMAAGISLVMLFNKQTAYMLGSSDQLLPLVLEYMNWIVPFSIFSMLANIGMFMIRLDGSPKFAMLCNVVPALINVVLDYVFVFPMQMGLTGAALATALAEVAGRLDGVGLPVRLFQDVTFIQVEDEYEKPSPDLSEHRVYDPVGSLGNAGRTGDRLHDAGRQLCFYPDAERGWRSSIQCSLLLPANRVHDRERNRPVGTADHQLQLWHGRCCTST